MITIARLEILPEGESDVFDALMRSNALTEKPMRIGLVDRKTLAVVLQHQVSEADRKEIAIAVEEHYGQPSPSIASPPPIIKELED